MKERCWEVGSTETNKGPDYISQTVISDLFIRPKNIFSGLPSNILRYCEKPQAESANSCMKLMKFQAAQHRLVWHPTMNQPQLVIWPRKYVSRLHISLLEQAIFKVRKKLPRQTFSIFGRWAKLLLRLQHFLALLPIPKIKVSVRYQARSMF